MQKHKYNFFPELSEDEFDRLKDNIKTNGYDDNLPIVLYDGQILDGWNRHRACLDLNIKPSTIEFTKSDSEALDFSIRANKDRRHLSSSQMAALAVNAEPFYNAIAEKTEIERRKIQGESKSLSGNKLPDNKDQPRQERTAEKVAKAFNTNNRYVKEAKKLRKERPEVFEQVLSGEKNLSEVKKEDNHKNKTELYKKELQRNINIKPSISNKDFFTNQDILTEQCDLIMTDPPYSTDVEIKSFVSWVHDALKMLKDTGQAYIFIGAYPNELKAYLNLDYGDFNLQDILIWNYNNATQIQPNEKYNLNYQACLYIRGKNAPHINKPSDGKKQYACQTINAPDGRLGNRVYKWQKPDELTKNLILNSTKEGDLIYDFFAGSGTTLINAGILGRESVGFEIDKDVFNLALERGCNEL